MQELGESLSNLLEEGEQFTYENFALKGQFGYPESLSQEWLSWTNRVRMIIEASFGYDSPVAQTLMLGLETSLLGFDRNNFNKAKAYISGSLKTAIDSLSQGFPTKIVKEIPFDLASGRIFIVHGHDDVLKTELEIFLKGLDLDPIVLHRQPDQGATLLEKFERHADVGFAFILLTPDDIAFARNELKLPEENRKMESRARPNVIFEFGFFVGRLGRPRVCCIYKDDVILPSDLEGLVYKKVEGSVESIGYPLIKELKAAGYTLKL